MQVLDALVARDCHEITLIDEFINSLSENVSEESWTNSRHKFQEALADCRRTDSIPVITDKIAQDFDLSGDWIRLHYNLFVKPGYEGLTADGRGKWERVAFLEYWELDIKFDNYLKMIKPRELSCEGCKEFINVELRKTFPINHDIHKEPLLSLSTVHSIMLEHGCIWKEKSQVGFVNFLQI